jgi:hypothetical protein
LIFSPSIFPLQFEIFCQSDLKRLCFNKLENKPSVWRYTIYYNSTKGKGFEHSVLMLSVVILSFVASNRHLVLHLIETWPFQIRLTKILNWTGKIDGNQSIFDICNFSACQHKWYKHNNCLSLCCVESIIFSLCQASLFFVLLLPVSWRHLFTLWQTWNKHLSSNWRGHFLNRLTVIW